MLRGIPAILSPELLKTLMEMGHGDEIVLADGNFPAASNAQRLIRSDGHTIAALLEAIIPFFPLDYRVERPAVVMALQDGDQQPPVWELYKQTIQSFESDFRDYDYVERFAFYERARNAFAIVATGDRAFKGNLILKKGVVR
ncbi:RbsD/FucU family protein [Paenibacillus thalictri]|uniref:Fucose isomerase n=1 Tax=Paenibacillus thalictri TaxID=2527873 RepID=A0A4Q9DQX2_9BACL|nr:RbsD/FucU domain-containing protein [Paenibacillus thalictri]TBL78192.1 fucose isomerase [Paenibacillus thalictri]